MRFPYIISFVCCAVFMFISNPSAAEEKSYQKLFIATYDFDISSENEDDKNIAQAITDAFESNLYHSPNLIWQSHYFLSTMEGNPSKPIDFNPKTKSGLEKLKHWGVDWTITGTVTLGSSGQIKLEAINPNQPSKNWSINAQITNENDIAPAVRSLSKQLFAKLDIPLTENEIAFHNRKWFETKEGMSTYGKARKAFRQNHSAKPALAFYEKASELEPGVSDAFNYIGWTNDAQGDKENTLKAFNSALKIEPNHFDALLGTYRLSGDISQWNQLLRTHAHHDFIQKERILKALKSDDIDAALVVVDEQLASMGDNTYFNYIVTHNNAKIACHKLATDACRKSAEMAYASTIKLFGKNHISTIRDQKFYGRKHLTPELASTGLAHMIAAHKFFLENGYRQDEERIFRALQQIKDHSPKENEGDVILAFMAMGKSYQNAGDFGKAEVLYKSLVDMTEGQDSSREVFLDLLGESYMGLKRYEEAAKTFVEAVQFARKRNGDMNLNLIPILENLGKVGELMDKPGASEWAYKYAITVYKEMPSDRFTREKAENFINIANALVASLEAQGKDDEAEKVRGWTAEAKEAFKPQE